MKEPKGYPTVGQNRQFQWFKDPTFIYPIIPATCATMLLTQGKNILWLDAVAEQMNELDFSRVLAQMRPDYMIFEANTPLIYRYNEIINAIKAELPDTKIILCGEHVTAMPEEVKANCHADYFVAGGKWYFEVYKIITGNDWPADKLLPHINRHVTRWWLYAYKNGNYKYIPATYIMAAQDCWHRPGCTFCSWANYHKDYYVRPVEDVLQEIEELIEVGFKEIFDDSGTFPTGEWLRKFCNEMIERGYNDYISLGCNMRFGVLAQEDFKLMSKAGFRMLLWGMESVNQETLNRLNKCYSVQSISKDLILAKAAGLQSHLTVMFGYPWESYKDAKRTYDMARWLLLHNWAFSAQATICIPYPGTPLFNYCKENNLLTTENWDEYDMTKAVMKISYDEKELFKFQKSIYNIAWNPRFIFNKILQIRNFEDIKYYFRIGKKIYDRFGNFYEVGKVVQE
jgi:anaerobic magnesium-protoporphyrin IX monomethyl ester cyclase